ncbi:TonB-dependent receptor family protein [Microbulbifer magnicolonia]|uniref:TonB-dependent receptor family protein n=1 Tax=Microbulbifer magnicolonia TaxID=3109744 RepID=UPI002B405A8B|nr:TonB-dependent receptor [Microbulbifer sp. GG15]
MERKHLHARTAPSRVSAGFSLLALACACAQAEEAAVLETVEVTGTNPSLEVERVEVALTPGGVSLIDMERVREGSVSNLADMLRYVPGVWSASATGNDGVFMSSRGSNLDAVDYDMNGIKLLQDGLPVTAADGNNHNRMIDPLSARYAVFARGANAQKYGASTLGGAVNFISPSGRDSAPLTLSLSGGSHGLLQARATAAASGETLDALVTLEGKERDGYREHDLQSRQGLYANVGARLSSGIDTRFYVTAVQNDQELAGALSREHIAADPDQAGPNAISGHFQYNVDTVRFANKTVWRIDENRSLEMGLAYEDQELYHPIVDKIMVPIGGQLVEVFSLLIDTQQRDASAMLRYQHAVGEHNWLFGINYGDNSVTGGNYRNDGGKRNGQSNEIDNSANTLEAFAMDRWQLNSDLTLIAGAQLVSAKREIRDLNLSSGTLRNPRADYSSINPRLGFVYSLGENGSLFANVSRLFEAPTSYQLEDEVSASDETLEGMHGQVLEVGSRGQREFDGGSWNWDASLYYAQIRDEILSVDDPDAPGTSLSSNIDRSLHAGLEALVSASFAIGDSGALSLAPLLSLSLNHFRFDDDTVYGDNQLPAAPEYAARAEFLYRHSSGFYFGPTLDVVGERYADFSNTYTVDGYGIWGLRAGLNAAKWRVFAEMKNLTDKEYIARHSVRDIAAVDAAILHPGEPLSAYAGVEWQF